MSKDFINRVKSRIQLDKDNGWIFGVCAGLANYWRLDPTIVRVGTLVAALFFHKIVIAAYLIAWLILDEGSVFNRR